MAPHVRNGKNRQMMLDIAAAEVSKLASSKLSKNVAVQLWSAVCELIAVPKEARAKSKPQSRMEARDPPELADNAI
ncbi:hypothetical protein G7Y89_g10469 [Cudoniella acicularis]|uniref:Uncharacterized protein n=1 Tax=Cudoniella acicularis TaxID=354080 RepID=A0A8H4VZ65_9HELO|nr:hypothetical protein G7Y89_g10469 [Cudoniella acicularis]